MRKTSFAKNNFYHIYNRGVDKRSVFEDEKDLLRFLQSMEEFNTELPIGSIYQKVFYENKNFGGSTPKKSKRLVNFIAFCVNQNHFHFILEPLVDDGIQKFMHRISTGYTCYFNEKHNRSGALFQGRYKAIHIETNEYLLHLSAYVNLNDKVHRELNKEWMKKYPISSFSQYTEEENGIKSKTRCEKGIVLEQFKSKKEYEKFATGSLQDILKRKEEIKDLLLEE